MTTTECPGKLFLTSGSSTTPEEVPRLDPSTSYRTLGAYIAVDGNMRKALALNRQKSEDYAGLIHNSTLTRCEAYFSYILYFYPKISYALPVSTFTLKECNYIQAPALSSFLPKIGLNRHTARSIIFGPTEYGGLQMPDVYTDQGIGQLRLFLGHLRRGDQTSKLLMVAVTIMQQRVGSKLLFLNLPYPKYSGWVEKTWLTSLWQFVHIVNLRIRLPQVPLPREQRQNDAFLMTEFIYSGFQKSELELINQCRLFHQVITIADIASADGTQIDPVYTSNIRHVDRTSPLQWPTQNCPSPKAWRQWNRALAYLQVKGKLEHPLGEWCTNPHQRWSWVVRLSDMVLFHKIPNGWERFAPLLKGGNLPRTRAAAKPWYSLYDKRFCRHLEGSMAAATLYIDEMDGGLFTITWSGALPPGYYTSVTPSSESSTSQSSSIAASEDFTLPQYIPRILDIIYASEYFKRLVGPIHMPSEANLVEVANIIQEGTLLVCSDGSFCSHSGTGSHAWLFATSTGEILIQGAGPIDCLPSLLSSYRPELGGITTLLFLLSAVVQVFGIAAGNVTLFCDNQSALDNVFDATPKRGIYPLLAVEKVQGRWVKGHYKGDDRQVQHDLNALVDSLATQFREEPPVGFEPSAIPLYHPSQIAAVYMGDSIITSHIPRMVYTRRYKEALEQTICKRYRWTTAQFSSIDWTIFGKVFRTYSRFQQISLSKFIHGLWHTGRQKVLFKQDEYGLCPCCKIAQETVNHIFQCPDPAVVYNRERLLTQFAKELDERELSKSVRQCIQAGMIGWTQSQEDKPLLHAPTRGKLMPAEQLATVAFVEQTNLGWDAFFRGQLSTSWRKAILYTSSVRDNDTTETHLRWLLKQLHKYSLDVWKFRNGVLHGATNVEQRKLHTDLLRTKVTAAYDQYYAGKIVLFTRDHYIFSRKPLAARLTGDDQASSGNSQVPLNQQVQVGMTLGSAISPAVFLLTLNLENQVDSTTEGSQGDSTAAASVITSIEADPVLGSTIATTTSYMSTVDVALLEEDQVPRIVEYELEIPFCELDDPPDMSTVEAASRCERENER